MSKIAKTQPVGVLIDRHSRSLAGLRRKLLTERDSERLFQLRQDIAAKTNHLDKLRAERANETR